MRPALLARAGVAGLAALGVLALASLIHRELKLAVPGETMLLAPSTWRRDAPAYISARDAVADLNKFFDGFRDEGPAIIAAESRHAATRTYGHAPQARTVNSPGYDSRPGRGVDRTMSPGRGRGIRRRVHRLQRKQEQFQQEQLQMAERMQKLLQKLLALDTTQARRVVQLTTAPASHTSSSHASSHTSPHTVSHTDHSRAFTGNAIDDAAIIENHDARPHETTECIPPKAIVHGECINSPEHDEPPAHCITDPHSVACQSWHTEHQERIAAYHSAIQHSGYDPYPQTEHRGRSSGLGGSGHGVRHVSSQGHGAGHGSRNGRKCHFNFDRPCFSFGNCLHLPDSLFRYSKCRTGGAHGIGHGYGAGHGSGHGGDRPSHCD